MKLEYRYGQIYYSDLHPGDMLPVADGNYMVLTGNDIDENGNLKQSLSQISNSLEFNKDKSEHKVKLGDLTLRETKIICSKYKCFNCPLFPKDEVVCLLNSSHFTEEYLDQEIEVEEDV